MSRPTWGAHNRNPMLPPSKEKPADFLFLAVVLDLDLVAVVVIAGQQAPAAWRVRGQAADGDFSLDAELPGGLKGQREYPLEVPSAAVRKADKTADLPAVGPQKIVQFQADIDRPDHLISLHRPEGGRRDVPLGKIFSSFMPAIIVKDRLFPLMKKRRVVEDIGIMGLSPCLLARLVIRKKIFGGGTD